MLEENKIYNMDCLEGLRQIRTGSVQAIITDPPYFQGLTQNGQRGDFADLTITKPFWKSLAREIARVLKPDGEFYIFMDWRGYAFYYPIFAEYLPVKNLIVWDKGTGPGSFYSYTHEFILYGTKNAGLRRGAATSGARMALAPVLSIPTAKKSTRPRNRSRSSSGACWMQRRRATWSWTASAVAAPPRRQRSGTGAGSFASRSRKATTSGPSEGLTRKCTRQARNRNRQR